MMRIRLRSWMLRHWTPSLVYDAWASLVYRLCVCMCTCECVRVCRLYVQVCVYVCVCTLYVYVQVCVCATKRTIKYRKVDLVSRNYDLSNTPHSHVRLYVIGF